MTRNAKGNLRYRAPGTIATIALVAGGYLVMLGTTADPAAGQSRSEVGKGGWVTQVSPAASSDPAASKRVDGKDDLFLPGPQYDKNYDAQKNVDIYGAKSTVELEVKP